MNDDFDDLDRALFALPLAEPPPDLRQAILRATTLHVAGPSLALRTWETALVGGVLAIAAWLLIALVHDPRGMTALGEASADLARHVADPAYLIWLAAGTGVATWVTLAYSTSLRRGSRAR